MGYQILRLDEAHEGRPKNFSVPPGLPRSRFQGCHGPKMGLNGPNRLCLLKYFKQGVIWGTKFFVSLRHIRRNQKKLGAVFCLKPSSELVVFRPKTWQSSTSSKPTPAPTRAQTKARTSSALVVFLFYNSLLDYTIFGHAKIRNYFGSTWEPPSPFNRKV